MKKNELDLHKMLWFKDTIQIGIQGICYDLGKPWHSFNYPPILLAINWWISVASSLNLSKS